MWQPQRHLDGDRTSFPLQAPAALAVTALAALFLTASWLRVVGVPEVEESALLLVRLGPDRG